LQSLLSGCWAATPVASKNNNALIQTIKVFFMVYLLSLSFILAGRTSLALL
jgi:hypothetical protein